MGIIPKVVLAAVFTFMAVLECSGVQLKIISFNIENLGDRDKLYDDHDKGQVSDEAQKLAKILRNYDIIFIQEIKGSTNSDAVTDLKDILNKEKPTRTRKRRRISGRKYEVVWPGCFFDSTGNWETYAYYINTEKIQKWDANLYPSRQFDQGRSRNICKDYMGPEIESGNAHQYFVRPPYSLCVMDNADTDSKCLFFLLGLHAKPLGRRDSSQHHLKTTREELDNLQRAFRYFEGYYKTCDAILMGDLNADGEYLTFAQFRNLELTKSGPGKWIYYPLGQQQYTNVNGDNKLHPAMYDRFYGTTDDMLKCVKYRAEVVNDQRELIRKISDHYPIAITIDCDKFDLDGSGGVAASCPKKARLGYYR